MIKVAIDLTWVRHGIVGGTEAYATNLVDGFATICPTDIQFYLLTAKDQGDLFVRFSHEPNMEILECPTTSASRTKRTLWQNFAMSELLRKNEISICIEPVYQKPPLASKKIHFITTVHDLQAAHYPEYFSKVRCIWMKFGWKSAISTSDYIIVTSEFVRQDILSRYRVSEDKLVINYDPVTIDTSDVAPMERLQELGATAGEYYYIVTSLLPHKNVDTVIRALGKLKAKNSPAFRKLIVSGVGGKSRESLLSLAEENGIGQDILLTPFISVAERNLLYQNCKTYLFPSLFEGFGMTPIEAMLSGVPVLSSKESCTYETTGGILTYVENAKDADEWAAALEKGVCAPPRKAVETLVAAYSKESVASRYLPLIRRLAACQ